jgi:hypothetical protein
MRRVDAVDVGDAARGERAAAGLEDELVLADEERQSSSAGAARAPTTSCG